MNTPICKNLKQLRLARGLTQEQLAQRVHLTRQTISSYESGRTQPDLDILKLLADALDVDILVLLYGTATDSLRPWRKGVALVTVILVLSGLLIGAALHWARNTFFPVITDPLNMELLATRMRLSDLSNLFIGLALWAAPLGGLSTLLLTLPAKPAIPISRQVKWAALLGIGSYAVTLPWLVLDAQDRAHAINYLVYPEWIFRLSAFLLAISLLVSFFRSRKAS